jgi:hypothetical protein
MAMIGLRNLCEPALLYLIISLVAIMIMASQQYYNNVDIVCLGSYSCDLKSGIYIIFVVKLLYILFWTWILNIICRYVSTPIAWFLVFLPYIIFFIIITYIFIMT